MIRKLDELGRVVIPIEYREKLGLREKEDMEMALTGDSIVIKKAVDNCIFCKSTVALVKIGNICVCRNCSERLHTAKDGEILYPVKID